jgi:hypothetical protein
MSTEETQPQTIVNNYSLDIRGFINDAIQQEQSRITDMLVQAKILRPTDDGTGLVGIVYANWESRNEEGHQPELSLVTLGGQPEPEVANDSTDN